MKQLRRPLNDLLKNGGKFEWQSINREAFVQLKKSLSSDLVFTHFDPNKDIVVATDAMGAAFMHRFMHFAATFNASGKNYSQIGKKARALIFGLKRSHFEFHCTSRSKVIAFYLGSKMATL